MSDNCFIDFKNVSLKYDLNYEGVNSFKEFVLNLIYRRKPPVDRPQILRALDSINIRIEKGERVGIIGLNGSGKSTFLKVASGILKPQEGTTTVYGNVQPLIEIGAGFNPEFSGRENIYLNGAMLGFSPKTIKDHENEIIEFSELTNFIDIPVKYYSSGMAVRLAFTIATMIQPEILLMDEMLSAGDLSFIEKAKSRIEKILHQAKILILVSHDLGLISSITTRCLMMEGGKILMDGPTEKVLEFYRERTADRVAEQKRQDRNDTVSSFEEQIIKNSPLVNLSVNLNQKKSVIEPDSELNAQIGFDLEVSIDEIFVNFQVVDRLGVSLIHLRNDYSNLFFKKCSPGKYSFEIKVPRFPLKSGKYFIKCRVVLMRAGGQSVFDSIDLPLEIAKGKENHNIIEHSWSYQHSPQ